MTNPKKIGTVAGSSIYKVEHLQLPKNTHIVCMPPARKILYDPTVCGMELRDLALECSKTFLKVAWNTFHSWWKEHFNGNPVSKSTMPPEVSKALKQITEAPIPTYEGFTGVDSCYVIGVNMNLVD